MTFDNPALSGRIPLFCGINELPQSFRISNQNGFTTASAAWAFRRASRLAQLGWGKTRQIVEQSIKDQEDRAFAEIPMIEKNGVALYARDPEKARAFLTSYCRDFALAATQKCWDLGDELWDTFAFEFFFSPEERRKWR